MARNIFILFLCSALPLFAGCSGLIEEYESGNMQNRDGNPYGKIINTSESASAGSLLVYTGGDVTEKELSDAVVQALGEGTRAERVFSLSSDDIETSRRYNLHRWYQVWLPDGTDVGRAASELSGLDAIQKIQFNTLMKKASDCRSFPAPTMMTRAGVKQAGAANFNDVYLPYQWHYHNSGDKTIASTAYAGADINVKDAWRLTAGDPDIIVAVVDEGVQSDHPDLAANMWVNSDEIPGNGIDDDGNGYADDIYGYNFVSGGPVKWSTDGNTGHGTHVAGTVAAVNGNGTGVCGIAGGTGRSDGVRIMSCQIFDGFEGGDVATTVKAVKYAADNGACILQCSYGLSAGSVASDGSYAEIYGLERDAYLYFMNKSNCPEVMDGGLLIFAAGNEGAAMSAYPGAYNEFISVTSIASDGLPAYYTNYGPGCNVAAPGGEYNTGAVYSDYSMVLSTMPTEPLQQYDETGKPIPGSFSATDYGYMQGTSMACPHVSGVAALGVSYAKKLGKHFTREEMVSMLLTSVNDVDSRLLGGQKQIADGAPVQMYPYYKNMGTGYIDAWKFLMQIEGTPWLTARTGVPNSLDLKAYFGDGASAMTFLGVDISDEDMAAIGLEEKPEINKYNGKLKLTPTKAGAACMTVRAIAGGNVTGGGDAIGGMEISKKVSVISRSVRSDNGGWL